MLKKYKYSIAFVSWMVFVAFSSLSSFKEKDVPYLNIPHLDKAVHFTFYFVAAVLGVFLIREVTKPTWAREKAMWVSVVAAVVFGIIIEVLQYTLTSDRQGDVLDALANTVGALVGIMAVKLLFSGDRRLKWEI